MKLIAPVLTKYSCRCRHEFCYLCVAKWKTCKCAVWDEHNILQPVAPPVAVDAPAPHPQPAMPANQNAGKAQPQAQAQPPIQRNIQPQVGNNTHAGHRANRRNRRKNRAHVHNFERYYRSEGWDTACHRCGHTDRWVNCCFQCGLCVCWYCTKHPV